MTAYQTFEIKKKDFQLALCTLLGSKTSFHKKLAHCKATNTCNYK